MSEDLYDDFEARLIRLTADCLDVEYADVRRDARFVEDLGADSLDIPELAMRIEEEFGVRLADERVSRLKTVGEALELVVELVRPVQDQ